MSNIKKKDIIITLKIKVNLKDPTKSPKIQAILGTNKIKFPDFSVKFQEFISKINLEDYSINKTDIICIKVFYSTTNATIIDMHLTGITTTEIIKKIVTGADKFDKYGKVNKEITMEQLNKIADLKKMTMTASTREACINTVKGSLKSMGLGVKND